MDLRQSNIVMWAHVPSQKNTPDHQDHQDFRVSQGVPVVRCQVSLVFAMFDLAVAPELSDDAICVVARRRTKQLLLGLLQATLAGPDFRLDRWTAGPRKRKKHDDAQDMCMCVHNICIYKQYMYVCMCVCVCMYVCMYIYI